jgi:hypothetical protein
VILDTEAQRKLLLEMFDAFNFPGKLLEQAFSTKQALRMAQIEHKEPEPKQE